MDEQLTNIRSFYTTEEQIHELFSKSTPQSLIIELFLTALLDVEKSSA